MSKKYSEAPVTGTTYERFYGFHMTNNRGQQPTFMFQEEKVTELSGNKVYSEGSGEKVVEYSANTQFDLIDVNTGAKQGKMSHAEFVRAVQSFYADARVPK
jgi:hypothetical protein